MGSQVVMFFFKWVEAEGHGGGGPRWVENHLEALINVSSLPDYISPNNCLSIDQISGCMLGAAKGVPAVLSGEMKDTAQLNTFAVYGLERFFSREERAEILRAMPGISSMLPKGGDAVWGNLTWAPDDVPGQATSNGAFIKFANHINGTVQHQKNLTVAESIDYLLENTDDWYRDALKGSYSHGIARTKKEIEVFVHTQYHRDIVG